MVRALDERKCRAHVALSSRVTIAGVNILVGRMPGHAGARPSRRQRGRPGDVWESVETRSAQGLPFQGAERISFLLTNSSAPSRPSSRPKPERLTPVIMALQDRASGLKEQLNAFRQDETNVSIDPDKPVHSTEFIRLAANRIDGERAYVEALIERLTTGSYNFSK